MAIVGAACSEAEPLPTVAPTLQPGASSAVRTVTLITGDRISVALSATPDAPHAEPGPGREHVGFITMRVADEVMLIPRDVAPLVASGQLDRDLFSVTQLMANGYDDAQRDDLPLIITGQSDVATARRRLATADVMVDHVMPALGAMAVRQRKTAASSVLAQLASEPSQRVWLDRRYALSLDHSVPQVGAPAAWATGYTGQGVVVAVLDTGIDAAHPDLAGKVLDAQSFVDDGLGSSDVLGHGTHVASIIAGTGAASGGQFRGVAPDAQLISGRVCTQDCAMSALLAGMEWAVVTKQAKIVNLSLGGGDRAGIDPLEAAVNRLSAEHGVLFVSAAGNRGEIPRLSVDSPSTADAALSVGAVDGDGQRAAFSGHGPRIGDGGLKPEITAPGVNIVAARAAIAGPDFGEPVGTAYLRLSGTSMATPHVAGAAAILLQQHPGWTGEQLKAALMDSANPRAELTVFEQGAGLLDVARATRQAVTAAPASLGLGVAVWPHDDDPILERKLVYHNDGDAPITLAISSALGPPGAVAAGMVTVDRESITVPAGGDAAVLVTIDTNGERPDGVYTGAIVATAGDVRVRTPIGLVREIESYDLSVEALDSTGNETAGFGVIWSDDFIMFRPPATLRLPKGPYTLSVATFGEFAVMVYPRLVLSQSTAVVMDGRAAKPFAPKVPGTELSLQAMEAQYHDERKDLLLTFNEERPFPTAHFGPDAAPGEIDAFMIVTAFPEGDADGSSAYVFGHRERDHFVTGRSEVIPPDRLATVRVHHRGDAGLFYRKSVVGALDDAAGGPLIANAESAVAVYRGAFDRTEYYAGDGFRWAPFLQQARDVDGELVLEAITGEVLQRYRPGRTVIETWNRAPFGPAFSDVLGSSTAARRGNRLLVSPSLFSEVSSPSRVGLSRGTSRSALFRDGELVLEDVGNGNRFPTVLVPPAAASYRFEAEATRPPEVSELSSRVTAVWAFRSAHVDGSEPVPLPLPTLRFAPALDEQNRARRLLPLILPVAIERPAGAPTPAIDHTSVEASFDDGATWAPVFGALVGDRWLGIVLHPPRATYVSLRGSASDVEGNRVEQTIIRAYKLAP